MVCIGERNRFREERLHLFIVSRHGVAIFVIRLEHMKISYLLYWCASADGEIVIPCPGLYFVLERSKTFSAMQRTSASW